MTEPTPSASQPESLAKAATRVQAPGDAYCTLTRISDNAYLQLAECSYPLTGQHSFRLYYGRAPEDRLNLAQYYAGMRCLFGKPGNLYDDWKGSFSFTFKVDVFRNGQVHDYLLHIMHIRSYIEFGFRKIVANPKSHSPLELNTYHAPLDDEFSGADMETVEHFVYGFLQGYLQITQQQAALKIPEFVLLSESNSIVFGYINGQFFERHIEQKDTFEAEEEDAFEAEKNVYQHLISHPAANWPRDSRPPTILTIEFEHTEGP